MSFGIAVYKEHAKQIDTLIQKADKGALPGEGNGKKQGGVVLRLGLNKRLLSLFDPDSEVFLFYKFNTNVCDTGAVWLCKYPCRCWVSE